MFEFVRGQKMSLSELTSASQVEVGIRVAALPGNHSIDISAFGLDAHGKLSDDRYFIFYNQRISPCGSVQSLGSQQGDSEVFRIDLAKLPLTVDRIVLTATFDGNGTMAQTGTSHLRLLAAGAPVARFQFTGADFGPEKAVLIGELYRKGGWRFAATGQGFAGGLAALLTHFGGQIAEPEAASRPQPPPPAAPASAKVNIGKVTLEKRGSRQSVDLHKGGRGGARQFHVNLNWDDPDAGKKGFFGFVRRGAVDLDLGCMFELADGEAGVIQPLGGNYGSRHGTPYIYLDKDDRSGAAADGENLYLFKPDLLRKVVLFALIYEGTANFATVNGRMTIKDDSGTEILIRLDNPDSRLRFCAVALIERREDRLEIAKEERYFAGHRQCDEHYGFGFRWKAGSK